MPHVTVTLDRYTAAIVGAVGAGPVPVVNGLADGVTWIFGWCTDDDLFVAINEHWEDHFFDLPVLPEGKQWHVFVNTAIESPEDIHEPGQEPPLEDQKNLPVTNRSVVLLVGR